MDKMSVDLQALKDLLDQMQREIAKIGVEQSQKPENPGEYTEDLSSEKEKPVLSSVPEKNPGEYTEDLAEDSEEIKDELMKFMKGKKKPLTKTGSVVSVMNVKGEMAKPKPAFMNKKK